MFRALAALAALVLVAGCDDYKIIPKASPDDRIVHFIRTEELATACADDADGDFCAAYILGAADAWDMASLYWPSIRCRPIDVSAGEFVEVTKRWLKDQATDGASDAAASQILRMTRTNWPCPKTKDFDPSTFDDEGLRRDRTQ